MSFYDWSTFRKISKSLTYILPPTYQVKTKRNKTCVSQVGFLFFCISFFTPSIKDRGSLETLDKQEMFYDSMYLASKATSWWQSFLRSIEWWIWQTKALKLFHFIRLWRSQIFSWRALLLGSGNPPCTKEFCRVAWH